MAKTSLPPGFRFHPTDVELVMYYLKWKVMGRKLRFEAITEIEIYKYAPWDLRDKSCLRSGDLKWYFFCPREKKYANGARMNRATEFGYWKTTGKDRPVHYNNQVVGMIKTLVFHRGKAPHGVRTDWVMHEYRIDEPGLSERGVVQDAYVLCIVFQKDGPGPRNGAQYGAPFREEDWENDEDVCIDIVSSAVPSPPPVKEIYPVAESSHAAEWRIIEKSDSILPTSHMLPTAPDNDDIAEDFGEDYISTMLECFTEDDAMISNESVQNEKHDIIENGHIEAPPCLDGVEIYNGLGDLGNLGGLSGGGYDFFPLDNDTYNMPFIELQDLDAPLNCPAEAYEPALIQSNGLYADPNCYNPEQFHLKVDPSFNQSPPMGYQIEDQLTAFIMENSVQDNANEAPLNHDTAKLSTQSSIGSNCASEELKNGGSHYPW